MLALSVALAAALIGIAMTGSAAALAAGEQAPDQGTGGGASCAEPDHPGGGWPSLNHDLHNTRNQEHEGVIGADEARSLEPAWSFSVAEEGAEEGLQSTPIVANGCVYVTTGSADLDVVGMVELQGLDVTPGTLFALNADTGELVWKADLDGYSIGLAAADGLIYALPFGGSAGAHAVAFDALSGETVWTSERLDGERSDGAWISASPVFFTPSMSDRAGAKAGGRPLLFVPLSGAWGDGARVPHYFLDARTGKVVKRFFALEEEDYEAGYGGAGIWTTAAFDPATNHLYAGTADSEGHHKQHPRNNAIVKIDADPSRRSFASVVGTYQGTSEHYDLDRRVPGWQNNPACESGSDVFAADESASAACLEQDVDFGSSPNLYTDGKGRTLIAALQKSGVLHVVETSGMEAAWTKVLSGPHQVSNAATAAIDGTNLYVRVFPDLAFSFERTAGSLNWASSAGTSPFAYQPLTLANGVLYTITDLGQLVALDAATGAMLLSRPIAGDAEVDSCYGWGAGVAVARNTVYAPCDADGGLFMPGGPGALVAYRRAE